MTKPPEKPKPVSRDELKRLFTEQGWEARLKRCTKIDYYNQPTPNSPGTRTIGYLYKENGVEIALLFGIKRSDGEEKLRPCQLLIDGVWHQCP